MYPNERILAGVIGGGAAKNLDADLVLTDWRFRGSQAPLTDVEQQLAEPIGLLKCRTGGDTLVSEGGAGFDRAWVA
jgi:hypothetical protein